MNSDIKKQYIQSSALSVVSKAVMAFSAIFVLFALNRILEKTEFGLFMLALSGCLLAAICISGGFRSLILYYVSREAEKPMTAISLAWCAIISIGLSLITTAFSKQIADFMNQPGLDVWIYHLSFLIPAYSMNTILTAHYRADKEVVTMLLYQEILPAALKMLFLGLIWIFGLPQEWIAYAFILSFGIPFMALYVAKPVPITLSTKSLTWWDLRYGINIAINQMMSKSTSNLMMVMIGYFADSHAVADFAMALRISQILLIPKMVLAQLHVPRIGTRLARDEKKSLLQEYDIVRKSSLFATLFGCLALVLIGKPLLMIFGDYTQAYPLLLLMAAASVVRAGFGDAGDFLALTGRSLPILISNIISFSTLILSFIIFVSWLGNYGIGVAVFIAALASMISIATSLYRHEKIFILTPLSITLMALASAILFALAAYLYF